MQTLFKALAHFAETTPTKPAIVLSKKNQWSQFTYADLAEETDRWARIWRGQCDTPGAVVFLIVQHGIALYPAFLGAMRAGLIPSFLPYPTPKQDPALYWRSHKALFARVEPACILSYSDLLPTLRDMVAETSCAVLDIAFLAACRYAAELPVAPDQSDAQSIALLQHSSGTTGLKKGVALTYEQIRAQLQSLSDSLNATASDCIISWLPIYHDMGLLSSFMLPITLGATVVSLDAFEWLARPDMFFDEIARFQGTLSWLPNFAFNHLVRTRDRDKVYNLASMRAFINCSEPCKPETTELFEATFADHGLRPAAVQTCYGMAEIVFAATHTSIGVRPRAIDVDRAAFNLHGEIVPVGESHRDRLRFLSCGKPMEGVSLRISPKAKDGGWTKLSNGLAALGLSKRLPPELLVGEIQVYSAFLFNGYFRNRAANDAAFDGAWFRTGDMGFVYEGELYVCGRIKEMLIVHGRNYYANDIEEIVNRVDGIKPGRVVALGVYDPVTATEEAVIMAETVLPEGDGRIALSQAIRSQVFDTLSLSLRRVEIASEGTLIKTTSGKISREENVKRLGKGVFA
jgi:acyl-CoA synthetase (AMP-forming)/AMP-acid ligase II